MQEYINGKVLIGQKLIKQDFLIKNGKIYFKYTKTKNPKDIRNYVVAPSFVDLHVHTRTPGFEYKEDIAHVSAAALAGGFTTIVAMANVQPEPHDYKSLQNIQTLIAKAPINIIQVGKATFNGQIANIKSMRPLTQVFSDDGHPIQEEALMVQALKTIKAQNALLLLHEEDHQIVGQGYHSPFTKKANLPSFGANYESNLVARDITLNQNIQAKIHLQHVSCQETLHLLKAARKTMDISAEVTPHHLFFAAEDIDGSTNFKMNPPLNVRQHTQALRAAFINDEVNIIATDHAPHADFEKNKPWSGASNGVIGLETAFAAVNTLFPNHLVQTLRALSLNPAQRLGLDVAIKDGADANIVFIDPLEEWVFQEKDIKSKGHNSPWIGKKLVGRIKEVIWTKK